MKRVTLLLLVTILLVTGTVGCTPSANTPGSNPATPTPTEKVSPTEKFIVGLDDTFAPMGFRDDAGTLVGFDIDLARAVGEEMGVEVVFQPIDWDAKEMELTAKKIDCIWNGMSKTPEREEAMTLSQPYLNNKIVILANEGVTIHTKEDLLNYKWGTQAKSAALEVVQADPICGQLTNGQLSEYPNYDVCILDMEAGRIDLMIVDEVLGAYKNSKRDKPFLQAPVDFGEDLYVIGFRKEDAELCGRVEAALKKVQASGKAADISNTWFGQDIVLPLQ